jgi:hypothetical protein
VDLTKAQTLSHGEAIELIQPDNSTLTSILTLEAPHAIAADLTLQTGSILTQPTSQDVTGAGEVTGGTLVMTSGSLYSGTYGGTLSTTRSLTYSGATITFINGSITTGSIGFFGPGFRYTALRIPASFMNVDGPTPLQDFAPEIQPIPISLVPSSPIYVGISNF